MKKKKAIEKKIGFCSNGENQELFAIGVSGESGMNNFKNFSMPRHMTSIQCHSAAKYILIHPCYTHFF